MRQFLIDQSVWRKNQISAVLEAARFESDFDRTVKSPPVTKDKPV